MKKTLSIIVVVLIVFAAFSFRVAAEEQAPADASSSLKILILGTRHYSDFESIKNSLQKSKYIRGLSEAVASQNHIELNGTFSGDAETLFADVKSLAADRFDVQKKSEKGAGVVITLKKIVP